MELCASIQVQYWLTVLCFETRPNAKPETVSGYFADRHTPTKKCDFCPRSEMSVVIRANNKILKK